jgi:hypothetical protein
MHIEKDTLPVHSQPIIISMVSQAFDIAAIGPAFKPSRDFNQFVLDKPDRFYEDF